MVKAKGPSQGQSYARIGGCGDTQPSQIAVRGSCIRRSVRVEGQAHRRSQIRPRVATIEIIEVLYRKKAAARRNRYSSAAFDCVSLP
jgi:hypothetical protein